MSDQLRLTKQRRSRLPKEQWDRLRFLYNVHRENDPGLSIAAFRHMLHNKMLKQPMEFCMENLPKLRAFQVNLKNSSNDTLSVKGRAPAVNNDDTATGLVHNDIDTAVNLPKLRTFQVNLKNSSNDTLSVKRAGDVHNDTAMAVVHNNDTAVHNDTAVNKYECGHIQPTEFAEEVKESWQHYHHRNCPTCDTAKNTLVDRMLSDETLHKAMNHTFGTLSLDWPDEGPSVHKISLKLLYGKTGCLPKILHSCEDFLVFVNGSYKVRHLALQEDPPTKQMQTAVEGGKHPESFEYPSNQLLRNPGDGSIGLASWKSTTNNLSGRDYAFIGDLGISNESIKCISVKESTRIRTLVKNSRQGPAGGYLIPSQERCFDTRSMSKCTKLVREFAKGPKSRSTACAITYWNHNKSKACTYGSCYNDMFMDYRSDAKIRKMLLSCGAERERAVKEMQYRLKCLLAVDVLELEHSSAIWGTFQKAVKAALGGKKPTRDSWRAVDNSISLWHCVLLEYACSGMEYRNHQPVAAHMDGNPNHFLESMILLPVVATNEERSSSRIAREAPKGILCCPLRGVAFEITSGRDALQLQFENTIHCSDSERGKKTVSVVKS